MTDEPTATIRIGTAADRSKYGADEMVELTITAATLPSPPPPYEICRLPAGTAIVEEIPGGYRLRSPDGALFDVTFAGMAR